MQVLIERTRGLDVHKKTITDYFEKRQHDVIVKQSVRKLENLGFTITLTNPDKTQPFVKTS